MLVLDMDKRLYGERLDRVLTTAQHDRGITGEKAARAIGTTRQRMARWRVGESVPTILELYALSEELHLDVRFLTEPPEVELTPQERAILDALREGERRARE